MKENAPKLGQIITEEAARDAIHIAVAPVIAAHLLSPGAHVGLDSSGHAAHRGTSHIGVVDPFLKKGVKRGESFYMFLYPNTITGLRHQWSHPAFEDAAPTPTSTISPSEHWLRDFADEVGADYDEMMHVASTHCVGASGWGDYLCEGGRWEGQGTPKEFWEHYEKVTGKKAKDEYGHIFSCSC